LIVTVVDSSVPAGITSGPLSLTIAPIGGGGSLSFTSPTLPNAALGTPYLTTIGVTGGTAPYACSVTSGVLPAGLALTPNSCTISGLPTAAGTANLTLSVTDTSVPARPEADH